MAIGVFCAKDVAFLVGQAEIVFATKDVVNSDLIAALPGGGYASGLLTAVSVKPPGELTTLTFADIGSVDVSPNTLVMAVI